VFPTDRLLELFGLVSGLACVWLMIRQNVLTFPIGLAYAVVSVAVMARNHLYADVLLNAWYVAINAYGWWHWSVSKERTGAPLPVTRTSRRTAIILVPIGIAGAGVLIWGLSSYTNAELVVANSISTIMSFIAMWMSARKLLENWWVWLAVNVLSIGIYTAQGIHAYAVLYTVYLIMALQGYRAWSASMAAQTVLKAGSA